MCVFFIYWEHLKAQPIVVLEKPEIKPVTPGLQGIALIHYTTAFSNHSLLGEIKNTKRIIHHRHFELFIKFAHASKHVCKKNRVVML